MKILVINCGSSSIKFKLFEMPEEKQIVEGVIEKIGEEVSFFTLKTEDKTEKQEIKISNHLEGLELIAKALTDRKNNIISSLDEIKGVGHRVVHGGEGFDRSVVIDDFVIKRIEEYQDLAPLHNPHNLSGIKAAIKFFPESIQVAAFDTAFHTTIPPVGYIYGIPYRYYEKYKVRRYGFHGTSHRYVARRTAEIMGLGKYDINVITCHLGNGCSITACKNGKSVDTSMGLTPLEGLLMGTRTGDIDPGVIFYIAGKEGLSVDEINKIFNKKSGLLGISELSNDFRNLMENIENPRVKLAVDIFCYRIKKYIGSYMAVLGKVDAISFTAGIGENVAYVREKSLENLENFGIEIDKEKNKKVVGRKEGEISKNGSKIKVFVIPTNEELRIAFDTYQFIGNKWVKTFL